jgi:hypothetical protein
LGMGYPMDVNIAWPITPFPQYILGWTLGLHTTIEPFQVWHKFLFFFTYQNFKKLRSLPIEFFFNYLLLKP